MGAWSKLSFSYFLLVNNDLLTICEDKRSLSEKMEIVKIFGNDGVAK
jgi:hypothetical protein